MKVFWGGGQLSGFSLHYSSSPPSRMAPNGFLQPLACVTRSPIDYKAHGAGRLCHAHDAVRFCARGLSKGHSPILCFPPQGLEPDDTGACTCCPPEFMSHPCNANAKSDPNCSKIRLVLKVSGQEAS